MLSICYRKPGSLAGRRCDDPTIAVSWLLAFTDLVRSKHALRRVEQRLRVLCAWLAGNDHLHGILRSAVMCLKEQLVAHQGSEAR